MQGAEQGFGGGGEGGDAGLESGDVVPEVGGDAGGVEGCGWLGLGIWGGGGEVVGGEDAGG